MPWKDSTYRIFILGAGFSRPAGLPLASDLWREVRHRAQGLRGRGERFHYDLENYIEYRRRCDGVTISADEVNFEEFMRVLDIEHFLGLRGSKTWSADGNEGTVVVKFLIGQILAKRMPAPTDIPPLYLEFAKRLRPGDLVLTFNYDVLLERALDAVGKLYRLFDFRYESMHGGGVAIAKESPEEIVVFKLHGSIDWFDRHEYSQLEEDFRQLGISYTPDHPVFSDTEALGVRKLLEGPRPPDDPLRDMYRVSNIEALYGKNFLFHATPWLLSPSTMKIVYAQKLRNFWYGLQRRGSLNFGMAIIGYSLPPQDEYARVAVYNLVTNYQTEYWGKDISGKVKAPLVIVNSCQDEKELKAFKSQYAFVDWTRTVLHVDGLNEKALKIIFDGD